MTSPSVATSLRLYGLSALRTVSRNLVCPPIHEAETQRSGQDGLYNKLPHHDSVRLLEIEPGDEDKTLSCHLHSTRLNGEHVPTFEALSYAWGSGEVGGKILCNERTVKVSRNLYSALLRLRLPSRPRLIWVDAICINQANLQERSHQVSIMRDVYRSASRVVVWLGPDAGGEKAEVVMALLCNIINNHYDQDDGSGPAGFSRSAKACPIEEWLPEADGEEDFKRWWKLSSFFNLPWFWRLWVVQEVSLARSAVALCGDCEIAWHWIGLAAALIRNNKPAVLSRLGSNGLSNAYFMYRMSRSQGLAEPLAPDFHQLLGLTRQFEVTDKRDRIYGLLGLPASGDKDTNGRELFMEPDYTLSPEELYRKVAEAFLERDRSLRVLSSVQHASLYPRSFDASLFRTFLIARDLKRWAPEYRNVSVWRVMNGLLSRKVSARLSWVPRWEDVFVHALSPWDSAQAHRSSGDMQMQRSSSTDSEILRLKGIEVDVASDVLPHARRLGGPYQHYFPVILSGKPPLNEYLKTEAGLRLLARTITAGKSWRGTLIEDEDEHVADFAAYLLDEVARRPIEGNQNRYLAFELRSYTSATRAAIDVLLPKQPQSRSDGLRTILFYSRVMILRESLLLALADIQSFRSSLPSSRSKEKRPDVEALAKRGDRDRFHQAARVASAGRRLFVTSKGYVGLGPAAMMEGDRIVVLFGGSVPFVLRWHDGRGWLLIGECFVNGLMRGEAVAAWRGGELTAVDFDIL
ncbi:hypothetical protein FSOLCH5_013405 [Fusarium solani]